MLRYKMGRSILAKRNRRTKRSNVSKKMQRLKRSVSKAKKSLKSKRTRRANKRRNNNRRSKRNRLMGGGSGRESADVLHIDRELFVPSPIIQSFGGLVESTPNKEGIVYHQYTIGSDRQRFGVRFSEVKSVYGKLSKNISQLITAQWPSQQHSHGTRISQMRLLGNRHIGLRDWLNNLMELIFQRPPLPVTEITELITAIIAMVTYPRDVIKGYLQQILIPTLQYELTTVEPILNGIRENLARNKRSGQYVEDKMLEKRAGDLELLMKNIRVVLPQVREVLGVVIKPHPPQYDPPDEDESDVEEDPWVAPPPVEVHLADDDSDVEEDPRGDFSKSFGVVPPPRIVSV